MSSNITQCIAGCNESKSLGQYFIILLYTDEQQAHVKGICSTNTYHRLLCTCVFCHILLETIDKLTYG